MSPKLILIPQLLLVSLLKAVSTASAADSGLTQLDEAVMHRQQYISAKEQRIDSLRRLTGTCATKASLLDIYTKLYEEYLTFNFDSTMLYVDRADRLTDSTDTYDIRSQIGIHRALSLATSGHFSHATGILNAIDSHRLSTPIREEYFGACEWTYGVWAEYAHKIAIAPEFTKKSLLYLDSLTAVTDRSLPEYTYRLAERALRTRQYQDAEKLYLATLRRIPVNCRLYAQAAYALALTYKETGDKASYRKWLINAAISDQKTPLKENLALQQLALYLKEEEGDIQRANHYLAIALEDAIYYNNRLRMLEIAQKIPEITNVYQSAIRLHNRRLRISVILCAVLTVILGIVAIYIFRQRRRLARSSRIMAGLNVRLNEMNAQLSHTNSNREQYVSLFMNLCAAYIEKLNHFPIILKLKVKHLSDLNSVAERYVRPSETETREMFHNFDTAFLKLYPDYIQAFNSLLQPDRQIIPKKGELLNTDLRIYALVRMGVTESNKIATLLFLSPQTIFNHRTQIRNRALHRESFENDVAKICTVI